MTILDRAIAKQFLINTAVLLVVLFCFVVAVDVSLKFDEYMEIASQRASQGGGEAPFVRTFVVSVGLVIDLWWPRLLQLLNFMLGLVMIAAMGFTFAQMVRSRELVAMLAGGLSLWRAARPVLVVAAILSGVQLANQELVIPKIAPLLTREHRQAGLRSLGVLRLKPTSDDAGRVLYANAFDADAGTLEGLRVIERDPSGKPQRIVHADLATWDGQKWVLRGGRSIPMAEGVAQGPVAAISTKLDPTALKVRRFAGYRNSLSWSQMSELIESRKDDQSANVRIDEFERIRWGRLGVVSANLLGLMICMPFFLRREPIPMIKPALKCAPVAIVALMGGVLGATAAIPALPPQVSVFVPPLVLLPLAIAAITSIRT